MMLEKICLRQVRNAVAFFSISFLALDMLGFLEYRETEKSAKRIEEYGLPLCIFLYSLKIVSFLTIPINTQSMICSLFYRQEKLPAVPSSLPTDRICFRIVTRGNYPQMVKDNVQWLLDLTKKFEFSNFLIEVVTNKAINVPKQDRVRELVVPADYMTKKQSKYKARLINN